MSKFKPLATALAGLAALGLSTAAFASSHREAPTIAQDAFADNTDVYTFISPENPDSLVVVANFVPLLIPSSGPNFFRFSDDVSYEIHFDNDGDARRDVSYRFSFDTRILNGDTFLYNVGAIGSITDPNLNVQQTYKVQRVNSRGRVDRTVARDVPVAPWHVGDRSFPNNSYESVALQGVYESNTGERVFAGPRDEPFFVDLRVFDLLGVAGGKSTDGLNVMTIVLEVPISDIANGLRRPSADEAGPTAVVGVHATASRRRTRVLRRRSPERNRGQFVQVSRLAWPLVNEVVVPLKDKDKFNRSEPKDDLNNIGAFVLFPELTGLLQAVLGLDCPDTPADGRTDIAGLLSPNGTDIADLLRINITEGQTFADAGFPNGRWLEDDVVDVLLTVVCNNGAAISDGVDANDLPFTQTFPFVASPHSGSTVLVPTIP